MITKKKLCVMVCIIMVISVGIIIPMAYAKPLDTMYMVAKGNDHIIDKTDVDKINIYRANIDKTGINRMINTDKKSTDDININKMVNVDNTNTERILRDNITDDFLEKIMTNAPNDIDIEDCISNGEEECGNIENIGSVSISDGTISISDGTISISDGTISISDGTISISDGTISISGGDTETLASGEDIPISDDMSHVSNYYITYNIPVVPYDYYNHITTTDNGNVVTISEYSDVLAPIIENINTQDTMPSVIYISIDRITEDSPSMIGNSDVLVPTTGEEYHTNSVNVIYIPQSQQNTNTQDNQNQQNTNTQDNQNQQNTQQGNIVECWTEQCQLKYNGYMLQNNMWGIPSGEDGTSQGVYYYEPGGRFGWEWNRPNPQLSDCGQYVCPSYPEIVVGTIPGDSPSTSTTSYFPIRYGDINSWTSEIGFTYPTSPTGKYNLAYDIYWTSGSTKKLNVMIWVQGHHDEQPIGEISDGINTYIHYKRNAGSGQYWEWHAFELKNQGGSYHKVNVKQLLDNAFSSGSINSDWTVAGMELGSEVWQGNGRIDINQYNVVLNENTIRLVQ